MCAQKNPIDERRKYIRMDIKCKIDFKVIGKKKFKFTGTIKNISGEGIGITFLTNDPLPKNTPLDLNVTLPCSPKPVHLNGQVRWCDMGDGIRGKSKKPYSMGVRLVGVDENDEARFFIYVYEKTVEKFDQYLKL